ncbi:hypothetical protein JCM10212_005348 [Sporobolomyces blumeae]
MGRTKQIARKSYARKPGSPARLGVSAPTFGPGTVEDEADAGSDQGDEVQVEGGAAGQANEAMGAREEQEVEEGHDQGQDEGLTKVEGEDEGRGQGRGPPEPEVKDEDEAGRVAKKRKIDLGEDDDDAGGKVQRVGDEVDVGRDEEEIGTDTRPRRKQR